MTSSGELGEFFGLTLATLHAAAGARLHRDITRPDRDRSGLIGNPKLTQPLRRLTMNTRRPVSLTPARTGLLMGLAALSLTLNATAARAADESPGYAPASQMVPFGDLNLASPAGVKRLYDRIAAASAVVCASRSRALQTLAHDRICTELSIARAVKAIDRPELTAFVAVRKQQPLPQMAKLTGR
jgi:UrcA family protein